MEAPDGQAPPPERPEWLPEKFKTPEDMARSYSEAEQRLMQMQAQIDQEREQFSSALQNMESINEQTRSQQPWNASEDPLIQNFQRAVDEGDAQAMLAIQIELNRQMYRQEMQQAMQEYGGRVDKNQDAEREMAITMATERVARNYDNWEELAPRIGEFLQGRQHWIPNDNSVEGFERTLTEAAQVIMAQDTMSRRNAEEQDRITKMNQQGLQGQGAQVRNPEQDAAEWQRIKDIPLGGYMDLFKPK